MGLVSHPERSTLRLSLSPVSKSVGVDVLENDALDEPKLSLTSTGPSSFTVPLPTLLVAAIPMMMVEVRSPPMMSDLMSMFFMVKPA